MLICDANNNKGLIEMVTNSEQELLQKPIQKYFTNSQKEFFKDLLKVIKEHDRKEIIIKILLEASKFYRITVLTMLNISDTFLTKYLSPSTKIEYIISWTDWLLNKKRDYVKNFLVSSDVCYHDGSFLDFEILCFVGERPVILLRGIERFVLSDQSGLTDDILPQITNIIYALETDKIDRFIVATCRTLSISTVFNNVLGWDMRSSYDQNLSWLNELQ